MITNETLTKWWLQLSETTRELLTDDPAVGLPGSAVADVVLNGQSVNPLVWFPSVSQGPAGPFTLNDRAQEWVRSLTGPCLAGSLERSKPSGPTGHQGTGIQHAVSADADRDDAGKAETLCGVRMYVWQETVFPMTGSNSYPQCENCTRLTDPERMRG